MHKIKVKIDGIGGLKRPKKDLRDFQWHKKFGAVSELPTQDFDVWEPLTTFDQGANDLCTDYSTIGAAEAQFSQILDVCFQRAAHNEVAGTPGYIGGADPKQAALAVIKVGAIPQSIAPFNLNDSPSSYADISKYPQNIINEAGADKEFSLYQITPNNGMDLFDSIRSALWQSYQSTFKAPVMVGTEWQADWLRQPGGIINQNDPEYGYTDHAFVFTGQKTINGILYLKAHLSSGTEWGDQGFFYFTREIVNLFIYAQAFAPGSPSDYKAQQWTILQKIYDILISLLAKIKNQSNG